MEYKELQKIQTGLDLLNTMPVIEHNVSGGEVEYIYVEHTELNIKKIKDFNNYFADEPGKMDSIIDSIIDEATYELDNDKVIDLSQVMYGRLFGGNWDVWWQKDKHFYMPEWEAEQVYVSHEEGVIYMDNDGLQWWRSIRNKGKSRYEAVTLIANAGGPSSGRLHISVDALWFPSTMHNLTGLERVLIGGGKADLLKDDLIIGITKGYDVKPNKHLVTDMYDELVAMFDEAYGDGSRKEPVLNAVADVYKSERYKENFGEMSESLKAVAVVDFMSRALNLGITAFEKEAEEAEAFAL